jgi:N-acetylneuraminic acid mutarotase
MRGHAFGRRSFLAAASLTLVGCGSASAQSPFRTHLPLVHELDCLDVEVPRRWVCRPPVPTVPVGPAAATGPDDAVYVLGGSILTGPYGSSTPSAVVERYDPAGRTWTTVASLTKPRASLGAARGSDGRIYAVSGGVEAPMDASVEAYAVGAGAWQPVAPLATARQSVAVAAGGDGRIYAVGGLGPAFDPLASVEAYDASADRWSTVAPMPTARYALAAAAGPEGRVYAIGGATLSPSRDAVPQATVEVYDPAADRWGAVRSIPTPRYSCVAVLGADGRICVLGGHNGNTPVDSETVEVYDPARDVWETAEPLPWTRDAH